MYLCLLLQLRHGCQEDLYVLVCLLVWIAFILSLYSLAFVIEKTHSWPLIFSVLCIDCIVFHSIFTVIAYNTFFFVVHFFQFFFFFFFFF